MTDHSSHQPHSPLTQLLRTWQHQPADAADVQQAVWSRIRASEETAGQSGGTIIPVRHLRWTLPLAASLTILFSALAGGMAATLYNSATKNERMAAAYVRNIDPLQMTQATQHRH